MTLYDELGIDPQATTADIKKAFRKQMAKHHPDRGGDPQLCTRLIRVHEILIDEEKRAHYDRTGEEGKATAEPMDPVMFYVLHAIRSHLFTPNNYEMSIRQLQQDLKELQTQLKSIPERLKIMTERIAELHEHNPEPDENVQMIITSLERDAKAVDEIKRQLTEKISDHEDAIKIVKNIKRAPAQLIKDSYMILKYSAGAWTPTS